MREMKKSLCILIAVIFALGMFFCVDPQVAQAASDDNSIAVTEDGQNESVEAAEDDINGDFTDNDGESDSSPSDETVVLDDEGEREGEDPEPDNSLLGLIDEGTIYVNSDENAEKACSFVYDGNSSIAFYADINRRYKDEDEDYGMLFCFSDATTGKLIESDSEMTDESCVWYVYDSTTLIEGHEYVVDIFNDTEFSYIVTYSCYGYDGYCSDASINCGNTISQKAGKEKKYLVKPSNESEMAFIEKVSSSDKSIAQIYNGAKGFWLMGFKKGSCTITVTFFGGQKITKKVSITNGTPELKYTYLEYNRGEKIQNKVLYNNGKVKWSTTNKKVAKVSKKGKITCVNPGTCYIKAKVAGKTLKCKVKVYRLDPDFTAEMDDWSTRNKWISLYFHNYGEKTLTIYSSKAKYIDYDFKSCDRNLKLAKGKTVTIKPGKTKTVKFKIKKGSFFWDPSESKIRYYFKYDGKKYKANAYWDADDSEFYTSGEWWTTYWVDDEEEDDEDDDYDY